MGRAPRRRLSWLLDLPPNAMVGEGVLLEKVQLLVFVANLWNQSAPSFAASSASVILLLLVVGASTGEVGAAVAIWVGGTLELGVGSGCFFFLRRLQRLRRVLFTWAKASSAMSLNS